MADDENGPSYLGLQEWLMVNLDKRQYYLLTDRLACSLGIFWNFYNHGPENPQSFPKFDCVDLLTRSYKGWPRETAFGGEMVVNLDKIRQ
jgi:hypothetical protein